ncbi:hypothetical protein RUM43_001171 [Polyplax serrata]|uniref:Gamma tubulin complex component C-terminal domain-containing protein n=1 Tax=Polyplax serrata TaxID=468196 RepID=A0AAN8SDK5_POLSC
MMDNLICLLNKLSYQIVYNALNFEKNYNSNPKDEKYFKQCIRKVRQKGCDVLLKKSMVPSIPDPCITDYGGNWSPVTLLFDHGKDLEAVGATKLNDTLLTSMKCLQENEYDCVNDLLKFLLMMKNPIHDSTSQANLSLCESEFLGPMDSITTLTTHPSIHLSDSLSYNEGLKYEESWTRKFDSKFQVLGENSKKNLLLPENLSLASLFSARSNVSNQSQSNSFIFTDFCVDKNHQSERNIFDLSGGTHSSDSPLLDSFVDNPITHRLPSLVNIQRCISRSTNFVKSSDRMKTKLHLLKEEGGNVSESESTSNNEICKPEGVVVKSSRIELKRNSNCSHSFAILYEKSSSQIDPPSELSNDNLLLTMERMKQKIGKSRSPSSSKEIVLGLWEHDKVMLKEFRPELANKLPPLRMITTIEFVEDVKYLLTGINSGTFPYNSEDLCFNMKYGTCLSDITPESLFHFSKEFIETGNYYAKLSSCATQSGKTNLEKCTTISQAFWKSIFDYLELHYSMVLRIPVTTNLMMLKASVKNIHEMIITISNICNVVKEDSLPEGGQLLNYLLSVIENLNRPCIRNIVYSSTLVIQRKKMFLVFSWGLRKAYTIAAKVMYHHCFVTLKKDLNNYDKFCQILEKLNYPDMCLCLSDQDLEKQEKKFKEYELNVKATCGGSISISSIRNEEKEQEKLFLDYVKECKIKQEEERQKKRLQKLEELKKKREAQNKLLNDEISRMEKEKLKKKVEEQEALRKLEERLQRAADKEKGQIKHEKIILIKYYNEMMRALDTRLNVVESRKRKLQHVSDDDDVSENNAILDIINDNTSISETNKINSKAQTNDLFVESMDLNSNPCYVDTSTITSDINRESVMTINTLTHVRSMDENSNVNSVSLSPSEMNQDVTSQYSTESISNGDLDNPEYAETGRTVASNEALANKIKVMSSEFGNGNTEEIKTKESVKNVVLTQAMRNRLKILQQEFGFELEGWDDLNKQESNAPNKEKLDCTSKNNKHKSIDANEPKNVQQKTTAATEAMANKLKVLNFEYNSDFDKMSKNETDNMRISVSQRNVAAIEASENKLKVMKSEIGMGSSNVTLPPQAASNCSKVLPSKKKKDFEYNILRGDSDHILIKSVTSNTEICIQETDHPNTEDSDINLNVCNSVEIKDSVNFQEVDLVRKEEYTNIDKSENNSSKCVSITKISDSDSFLSTDNIAQETGISDSVVSVAEAEEETACSVQLVNPNYQRALWKDSNISNHKLSYNDVFHKLNHNEFTNTPCTDLMKFQRYLRKSVQIPLIIQEKLANDALLKHLLISANMMSHLKSLRGFFFLSYGEFGRSFIHNTFRSLSRCKESHEFFERSNLSNIVNEALNCSSHRSDQNSQCLSFQIVKMPPFLNHSFHDVLSPFELSYKIEWPLNIILTDKALSKYKSVFKFLLKLKRINWTLNENTLYFNSFFKNPKINRHVLGGSPHYHKLQIFRHAMIQVMVTLDDYIFSNGIQLPWIDFLQDLETTVNIDHLYQKHVRYLKDVLLKCFQTKNSKDLLNCIHNAIELALKFHYTAVSVEFTVLDGKYGHPKFDVLKSTFNEFCTVIKNFLRILKEKIASNQVIKSHYILIEKFDLKLT